MKEKFYTFKRQVIVCEFGGVTATSKEEAIEKIKNGDYDDIIDSWIEEILEGTITIESEDEE